jgi:hypothetical protein
MKLLIVYFSLPLYFIFYVHTIIFLCLYILIGTFLCLCLCLCLCVCRIGSREGADKATVWMSMDSWPRAGLGFTQVPKGFADGVKRLDAALTRHPT